MPFAVTDTTAASAPHGFTPAIWPWLVTLAVAASFAATAVILRRLRQGLPAVPQRPHGPVPWNGFDVLQVVLLHVLVLALGVTGLRPEDGPAKLIPLDVVAKLAATAFGAAYLVARGAGLADLGLAPLRPAADLRIAVAGVALLVAPLLAMASLLDGLVPYAHPIIDFMRSHRDTWSIGMVVASAVVAAPVAEEFFFRRVLQGWLEKILPGGDGRAAVAVAATIFAVAHLGQGLAFLPLFPLGLALGIIARRTGSVVPCILLHGLFNAVSVVLLVWQTSAPAGG